MEQGQINVRRNRGAAAEKGCASFTQVCLKVVEKFGNASCAESCGSSESGVFLVFVVVNNLV